MTADKDPLTSEFYESFIDSEDIRVGKWKFEGACFDSPNERFFPDRGKSSKEAKAICRTCTVRRECLSYAIATGQNYGVWGGRNYKERLKIRRKINARLRARRRNAPSNTNH